MTKEFESQPGPADAGAAVEMDTTSVYTQMMQGVSASDIDRISRSDVDLKKLGFSDNFQIDNRSDIPDKPLDQITKQTAKDLAKLFTATQREGANIPVDLEKQPEIKKQLEEYRKAVAEDYQRSAKEDNRKPDRFELRDKIVAGLNKELSSYGMKCHSGGTIKSGGEILVIAPENPRIGSQALYCEMPLAGQTRLDLWNYAGNDNFVPPRRDRR
jgi:hypothetical protein